MNNDFDYDVFISYAHKDNETASDPEGGWISMLHRALEVRLNQLLTEDSRIWRDPRLSGNDVLQDELMSIVAKTAVLVTILSPRYLGSQWCSDELSTFKLAAKDSGLAPGNKSRIFKVIKTPVAQDAQPQPLKDLLGYPFYTEDTEKKRYRELYPDWGPQAREEAATKLDDLAHEVRDLLSTLKPGHQATRTPDKGKIYLAETTSDKATERDQLMRELKDRGYQVLPDRNLPQTGPELEIAIKEALIDTILSIHLVGEPYGLVPEGSENSTAELQVDLAASYSAAQPSFGQLIWLPVGLKGTEQRQEDFINRLRNELELQDKTDDLLETPFHEFQTEVNSRLDDVEEAHKAKQQASLNPKQQPPTPTNEGLSSIYLLYEYRDKDAIKPIRKHLFELGYEVKKTIFDGDEVAIADAHRDRIQSCDAVLLYWGEGSEAWLDTKRRELKKALGDRNGRGFTSTAMYIAGSETEEKEDFLTREIIVITAFGEFSPSSLTDFLAPLESTKEGSNND